MKLLSFSVTNYRSITTAHKISMGDYTVLIGKNNEGKSNILRALDFSMNVLMGFTDANYRRPRSYYGYNWNDDFPIQLQNRKNGLKSIFRLKFELNEIELLEFANDTGSKLNGNIDIEIQINKDNKLDTKILKQGKGTTLLTRKLNIVARFISQRISFNYIPTIRTEKSVINIIEDTLAVELSGLEKNLDYINAISIIDNLQKSVLDSITSKIKGPLQEFLPTIKNIHISAIPEKRKMALNRGFQVIVDDGVPTSIEYKGDGIKSLAALAMIKNRNGKTPTSIIAIEEPESHLHPSAINQLNEILRSISEKNQVIITTHNPLFADRNNIRANIIVNNGKAVQSKNIKEIRDILGVKSSDNLINASYVLVVEGEDDKISLNKLLPNISELIAKAMKNNIFKIEEIGGAGNLSYKLATLRNMLCTYHVLLDNDFAGKSAYLSAEKDGLANTKNTTFTNCNGMRESEFEDCLNQDEYKGKILQKNGVDINASTFRGNDKWTERMKKTFKDQGKDWSEAIEKKVKYEVAESISGDPSMSLNVHKRNSIDALARNIEGMINSNNK